MKSILFIMNYRVDNKSRRKYDDQMNAVRRLGVDVWHIGHDDDCIYLCHGNEKTLIGKIKKTGIKAIEENLLYISIYKSVRKVLKLKGDFDYCYLRRYFFEGAMKNALKMLHNSGVKTIIEIPTYPHDREQSANSSLKAKLLVSYSKRYERLSAEYIDLFCPMGEHADSILGRPALNIENGIDIENIKLRQPHYKDGEYHIIALALMTFWHGYDRLIESLGRYYSSGERTDKIYLHLVGNGAILENWRKLAESLNISEYVSFDGRMNNEQMNEAFDGFDLGAASLGRYRSGLSVVYELKTREYMARGIPFIYATQDFVVDDFGKYCIKVSNDDSPIDMEKLLEFMKQMRELPQAGEEMREYARVKMSFDIQFKRIFDYLDLQN